MTVVETVTLHEHPGPGRLGRHVEHDPRSRGFAVGALPEATLRAVSHRRYGSPFDQGNLGSCTGNAGAGCLNTAPFHKTGVTLQTETDAVELYSDATHLDGFPGSYPPTDTGSSGLAVAKALLAEKKIARYSHAFSVTGAVTALQTVPVITGVPWFEGFDRPDATGLVKIAGQIRGGHEFEVVAFEPATTSAPLLDGIVEAINSWGKLWGLAGRFRFTVRTWASLLAQQGDVTVFAALP